jgi:hypothetical protein
VLIYATPAFGARIAIITVTDHDTAANNRAEDGPENRTA